jgi:hypothetical protein
MISMFLSVSLKKKIVTNFFLTIFFLTESFIMMTYSTYNICLCVTYSFIMMAPDAPELSRTKLVSDFVSALRASGVGSVDVKQHLMCCYDAYAQQVYVSTSSYAVECLHLLPPMCCYDAYGQQVYVCLCVCVCVCVCVCAYVCVCMCTNTHTHSHTYTHVYDIHIHIHIHIRIHTHICIYMT